MIPFRRRNRRPPDVVVEPTERDILDMRAVARWTAVGAAQPGNTNQPEGVHSTWDLFDAGGTFIESVSIACEGDGQGDALFFAGRDLVVLVKQHAEAMTSFRGQGNEIQESDL